MNSSSKLNVSSIKRMTLVDRVKEVKVRDPAGHARLQVTELDKAAKNSQAKRKKCNDDIENDLKEIGNIDNQIAMLKYKYDPLCEQLSHMKSERERLLKTLESCLQEEKRIMNEVKGTAHARIMDDFKLTRQTATMELQISRGFAMSPDSTFHQSRKL